MESNERVSRRPRSYAPRRLASTGKNKPNTAFLRTLARDPVFPLTFFFRNIIALRQEKWWVGLSPRNRRLRLGTMLCQRVKIVGEVKKWARHHGQGGKSDARPKPPSGHKSEEPSSYCTHCGLCCEIASGLADFPCEAETPEHWQRLFGEGLGTGHRFCPFLWESKEPRGSLCSIHSLRANPCRVFEEEDCDFVKRDPEYNHFAARGEGLVVARRCLFHLINSR